MPEQNRALIVFLCHAHSDKDAVNALYARLKREGVDVWLDKEKLLPGADWELEIRKAVREADVVVVCLSKQFNQAGFRQKEVRIALDAAMEKPEGEIFIIPARLEECDSLESLGKWHWVDLFESDGYQRLMLALRVRAEKIGATLRQRSVPRLKIKDEQKATREKAENVAAEKVRLEAEKLERQRIAKEQADREAAEKARLDAEESERQWLAKEQADREAADKLAREKAEKATAEKARLEAEEAERQRLAAASQKIGEDETSEVSKTSEVKAERRKTPRKPNSTVIVGGIGLVGIILVAIVASLWGDLFTPAPTPTKTPTKFFTPTATALPDEIMDNGVPMRLVPAGDFEMGSENGADDEKPVHTVYLDDYYMDKYEATNTLYKACVTAGTCKPPKNTSRYNDPNYGTHPVVYVDWNQAQAYCVWRGGSLPTEAQWEKAARGSDGRTYPWGQRIDCNKANYSSCRGDTSPVGSYGSGKSPYGIYDMAGNVWEWTADWYFEAYYQNSPSKNPLGADSSAYRALRGGSWGSYDYDTRSAIRSKLVPTNTNSILGFRCVRLP